MTQAHKSLHLEFWKQLRSDCDQKITNYWHRDLTLLKVRNIAYSQSCITNYALRQYFVFVENLEKMLGVTVREIWLEKFKNPATKKTIYKDIGRTKWHFVRRLVSMYSVLLSMLPERRPRPLPFYFSRRDLNQSCGRVTNNESYKIPKKFKTTRQKSCFVNATSLRHSFNSQGFDDETFSDTFSVHEWAINYTGSQLLDAYHQIASTETNSIFLAHPDLPQNHQHKENFLFFGSQMAQTYQKIFMKKSLMKAPIPPTSV